LSFDVLKYCFICVLKVYYLEDVIEKTGYRVNEDSPYALRLHSLIKVWQFSQHHGSCKPFYFLKV